MEEHEQLQAAIDALDQQRAALGDAVVDAALGPMRERLQHLQHLVQVRHKPPTEQSRKQVSVLFLDVVGSTALSQHLDPEDIHAVIDGALQACTRVVVAHGGKVLQYAGDSLLAAFGAAQSQEDDAERAVHCGLALLTQGRALAERVLREHRLDGCDVRVGIHTGLVLLGGGVDEEGSIRGLAVNVAARMEQTAPAGALRISHDTWLQVRGAFEATPQAPLRVKGHTAALQTYLVQRALPAAQRGAARGLEGAPTPLVGRSAELQRLLALPQQAKQRGILQAVTLIGEPGIGKSRLVQELQAALQMQPLDSWLLLGRALPPSRLQPYGLLRNLVAWRLQIADSDSLDQARTRLLDGLLPWLGAGGAALAPLIGQLIGLDFSAHPALQGVEPSALRQRAFAALHTWLRGLAKSGAVLLLLEDLHWADEGSLDFIHGLLHDESAAPLALVATARPELLERRADWPADSATHHTLHLPALGPAQASALAGALLRPVQGDAGALQQHIVNLADGNPFFIEELVRMCLDQGVIVQQGEHWQVLPDRLAQARMPTTLVGVLQARLDALPAAQRQALQQASIVGHVFWDQALATLDTRSLASLPALRSRALVQQRARSAFDGTAEEAFNHHVLQQVTYDTVLKPARQAGHAAAAAWLAQRMGDRPAEFLAVTAQHYERAGQLPLALDFYERAAQEAAQRFANAAVLEHTERALRCAPADDLRRRFALHGLRLSAADLLGRRSLHQVEAQTRIELATALADEALQAQATMEQALLASRRGEQSQADVLATRAAALAARSGAVAPAAMAQAQLAWGHHTRGEPGPALMLADQAVAAARRAVQQANTVATRTLLVKVLSVQAVVLLSAGAFGRNRAAVVEALALVQADGLRISELHLRNQLANVACDTGQYAASLLHYQAGLALAEEIGHTEQAAAYHYNLARALRNLKRQAEATVHAHQGLALAEQAEQHEFVARSHLLIGLLLIDHLLIDHLLIDHLLIDPLHADAGNTQAAAAAFDSAAAGFEAIELPHFASQAFAGRALLALAADDLPAACAWAERVAEAIAGDASLLAIDEPALPPLVCHRVWLRSGDVRAASILKRAHDDLQTLAARADDDELRHGLLHNVALHREVLAAWAAAQNPLMPS